MKTKEYYAEYRQKRAANYLDMMKMMDGKLDRILGALGEKILDQKKVMDGLSVPKPEAMSPQTTKDVLKAVDAMVGSVCCKCLSPAHYCDGMKYYCATCATRDAKPI